MAVSCVRGRCDWMGLPASAGMTGRGVTGRVPCPVSRLASCVLRPVSCVPCPVLFPLPRVPCPKSRLASCVPCPLSCVRVPCPVSRLPCPAQGKPKVAVQGNGCECFTPVENLCTSRVQLVMKWVLSSVAKSCISRFCIGSGNVICSWLSHV